MNVKPELQTCVLNFFITTLLVCAINIIVLKKVQLVYSAYIIDP